MSEDALESLLFPNIFRLQFWERMELRVQHDHVVHHAATHLQEGPVVERLSQRAQLARALQRAPPSSDVQGQLDLLRVQVVGFTIHLVAMVRGLAGERRRAQSIVRTNGPVTFGPPG